MRTTIAALLVESAAPLGKSCHAMGMTWEGLTSYAAHTNAQGGNATWTIHLIAQRESP